MLGLWLIERFSLLMVILFISLELSPRVCLHQRLVGQAAVFGQGITLMDGELGRVEQALLETGLQDAGWAWAGGAELSRAWPLTFQGEGNLSARDRKQREGPETAAPGSLALSSKD